MSKLALTTFQSKVRDALNQDKSLLLLAPNPNRATGNGRLPTENGDPQLFPVPCPLFPLRVNDLKQFEYCPRIVFYNTVMPVERKSTVKMERAKEIEFGTAQGQTSAISPEHPRRAADHSLHGGNSLRTCPHLG